jgi:hypothetical protein
MVQDELSDFSLYTFEHELVQMNENEVKKNLTSIELNPRIIWGATYATALFCLNTQMPLDQGLQSRAVQTLCSVFIGCPRLIIHSQNIGLLDIILSDKFPPNVVDKMLTSLKYMMMSEEVIFDVLNTRK